jgi:hypothetical protein
MICRIDFLLVLAFTGGVTAQLIAESIPQALELDRRLARLGGGWRSRAAVVHLAHHFAAAGGTVRVHRHVSTGADDIAQACCEGSEWLLFSVLRAEYCAIENDSRLLLEHHRIDSLLRRLFLGIVEYYEVGRQIPIFLQSLAKPASPSCASPPRPLFRNVIINNK